MNTTRTRRQPKTAARSVHGSGKAHIAKLSKTKSLSPNAVLPNEFSATCASCHDRMRRSELWAGSQHDNRNVGCPTCHRIHAPQGKQALLKAKNEMELCASCHQATIVNKTNRFAHMPLREGKMACASCHDMHGSVNVKLLRTGVTVERKLHQLSRREARPIYVGTRTRGGQLRYLP